MIELAASLSELGMTSIEEISKEIPKFGKDIGPLDEAEREKVCVDRYIEKNEDGRIYDKEFAKSYDSLEEWEKDQIEQLAKYEDLCQLAKEKGETSFKAMQELPDSDKAGLAKLYDKYQRSCTNVDRYEEKIQIYRQRVNDITDGKKKDDKGEVYYENGKLKPNTTYELNGNVYNTDDKGRIISVEAKPKLSPENTRDNDAQQDAGGKDRKPNDQGGHIVGRDIGGDSGIGNLVAMDSKINQSDFKRMENDVKKALAEGKDVKVYTTLEYEGDSERPKKIISTVTVDGEKTVYKFDNDIDGSLMKEVPEDGKEAVQDKVDATGGKISSIKEQYDENGNLFETEVTITYSDEAGNHRAKVVISNE